MRTRRPLSVLRRQWGLIVLVALLGLGTGFAASALTPQQYRATTEQFVSFDDSAAPSSTGAAGSPLAVQRVQSYARIVTSERVLAPVITRLGLAVTVRHLAGQITARNPFDTLLIQITVRDGNAAQAAAIANAVSGQLANAITDIETPAGGGVVPITVTTTQPAGIPTTPSAPRTPLDLAIGLIIGLLLGIGAAQFRGHADTRIGSAAEMRDLAESIPLGVIGIDPAVKGSPLLAPNDRGIRAEAYRILRTNLQFASTDDPARVIVVAATLADHGASMAASNLAIALGHNGSSVVLVDADLRRPQVATSLALDGMAGLTDILTGRHSAEEVIRSWADGTIDVLPSGSIPPNPAELLGSARMAELIALLGGTYDYVIIDAPPLLTVTDATLVSTQADGLLLVTRYGVTTRDQIVRAAEALQTVHTRIVGTLLTGLPRRGISTYGERTSASYAAGPARDGSRTQRREAKKQTRHDEAVARARKAAELKARRAAAQSSASAAAARPAKPGGSPRSTSAAKSAGRTSGRTPASATGPTPVPMAEMARSAVAATVATPVIAPAPPAPFAPPMLPTSEPMTFDPHGALLAGWATSRSDPADTEPGITPFDGVETERAVPGGQVVRPAIDRATIDAAMRDLSTIDVSDAGAVAERTGD